MEYWNDGTMEWVFRGTLGTRLNFPTFGFSCCARSSFIRAANARMAAILFTARSHPPLPHFPPTAFSSLEDYELLNACNIIPDKGHDVNVHSACFPAFRSWFFPARRLTSTVTFACAPTGSLAGSSRHICRRVFMCQGLTMRLLYAL